jgi:hypothetical protein
MEKYIYDVFDRLDPTHTNTDFYRSFFSKMTDKEFDSFFQKLFADKNGFLTWHITPYENDMEMENIEKAAKFMGVALWDYVVWPYGIGEDNKPIVTPFKVPIGYINEKRVQQTAIKKNSTSIDITVRDAKTNQVTGSDKNGRESIDENYALATYGAYAAMKEFMSFRADDSVMKEAAYSKIRHDGYVSLKELPDHIENKSALNMFDTYMISMGLKTDAVTDGYLTLKSLKREKEYD